MNILDAICQGCGKPIRWQPGTPLLCAACSQKKASQAFFATLLLALLISACSSLGGLVKSVPTPTQSGLPEQPMHVPYRPFTLVQACLDVTSSYPYADFKKAEGKIANAIDQFVRPNTGGLVVYANLITDNSWTDKSTFFQEKIDPIAADPSVPAPMSPPPATGNVFADKQHEKQAQQAEQASLASYQTTLKQRHAQLALLRKQVHNDTNALRSYSPAQTNIATDIIGCLERAASRMQGVTGNRVVLIASDLQQNTLAEDTGNLNLSGVRVSVIYHYCDDAATCQQVNGWFSALVKKAKATVSFHDVAESDALSDVFNA